MQRIFWLFLVTIFAVSCTKLPGKPKRENPFEQGNQNPFTLTVALERGGAALRWNRLNLDIRRYVIYRGAHPSVDSLRRIAWVDPDSLTYRDMSISEGYSYYYTLVAENETGSTLLSADAIIRLRNGEVMAIDGDSTFTTLRTVGVTLLCSRAQSVWLGSTPNDPTGNWRPMQHAVPFRLSDGRGMKHVYARFAYIDGDTTGFLVDSVETLPVIGSVIPTDTLFYRNTTSVSFTVSATGASLMRFSEDSLFTGVPFVPYAQTYEHFLSEADGVKRVFIQFDNGFEEPVRSLSSFTFVLDRTIDIETVTESSQGDTLSLNQTVALLVSTNEPYGTAWIKMVDSLGNRRDSIALFDELANGVYTLTYRVNFGRNIFSGKVYGYFRDRAGNLAVDSANTRIIIDLAQDEMIYLSGGTFRMGDINGRPDETPVHTVTLDPYLIDRFEVTNKTFAIFLSSSPDYAQFWQPGMKIIQSGLVYTAFPEYLYHPVRYVSYPAAMAYADWVGKRIPTEAEWEFAARGSEARAYPWGSNNWISQQANARPSGLTPRPGSPIRPDSTTTPIGFYNGNVNQGYQTAIGYTAEGIHDLSGNVSEWVSDWYDENYYSYSPTHNPTGPDSIRFRMTRGGSYNNTSFDVRGAARLPVLPGSIYPTIGFRCASSRLAR
ncbi:MAG: formylglycine-generating enzyme family protein [bacterium]|nr:formylglycine-generating enzyme family protein [bacterium]